MERGKERAELRAAGLKRLITELEGKRDRLLDEVAHKQGEAEAAAACIKRAYEMILDINKEEKSAAELEEKLQEERNRIAEEKKANAPRKAKVEKSLKGQKNSKKAEETIERARKARGAARARKKKED